MLTLGIAGGIPALDRRKVPISPWMFHDSAAALVHDSDLLVAIEEERLTRMKHTNSFPVCAVKRCLEISGIGIEKVDQIVYYFNEERLNEILWSIYSYSPGQRVFKSFRELFVEAFRDTWGIDVSEKISFVPHQIAHAIGALYWSGFDRALLLTLDGAGDTSSGGLFSAEGDRIRELKSIPIERSLGLFYLNVIRILGYDQFDEFKVMGLAPYGDPAVFRSLFQEHYTLTADGDFDLDGAKLSGRLRKFFRPNRGQAQFTEDQKAVAAALQEALETIVLHILRHYKRLTMHDRLCFSGGVAQNCALNGKILNSEVFKEVFVSPASHDAGCAVGAALYPAFRESAVRVTGEPIRNTFLGALTPKDKELSAKLRKWEPLIVCNTVPDIYSETARLLEYGGIVAWVSGRAEFGPRALGNRSLLADPREAEIKERINRIAKEREPFRPFAPAVIDDCAAEYFELPATPRSFELMTFVVKVKAEKSHMLRAVTHHDDTARLQTVSKESNPQLYSLLRAFQSRTGLPVLLNTSLNTNAEPIVDDVDDAVRFLITSDVDHLVVSEFLIYRSPIFKEKLSEFILILPHYCTLTLCPGGNWVLSRDDRKEVWQDISPSFAKLLANHDSRSLPIENISDFHVLSTEEKKQIREEILFLLRRRLIEISAG